MWNQYDKMDIEKTVKDKDKKDIFEKENKLYDLNKLDEDINKEWYQWKIDRSVTDSKILRTGGYKNTTIFEFIEFENYVIDVLHLMLRVTDKLFENLLSFFNTLDNDTSFDLDKRINLRRFHDFLTNDCKISSPIYLNKDGKIEFRSLNQIERMRFLNINFIKNLYPELMPGERTDNELNNIEKKFRYLTLSLIYFQKPFRMIKKDYTTDIFDKIRFRNISIGFLDSYFLSSGSSKITPYIHAFIFHIPYFIEKYKNLNLYSTQQIEKLNSKTKTNFFRNTNKKRNDYVKQLIEKANRIELIESNLSLNEIVNIVEDSIIDENNSAPPITQKRSIETNQISRKKKK